MASTSWGGSAKEGYLKGSTDAQLGECAMEAKLCEKEEQQPGGEEQHVHLHRDC